MVWELFGGQIVILPHLSFQYGTEFPHRFEMFGRKKERKKTKRKRKWT